MLKIGWTPEQATFVAQNRVSKKVVNRSDGPSFFVLTWDYMVEVPGRDGEPTRLVIRMKNPDLQLPPIGSPVSVLVNRRRTKAAFDMNDPVISPQARRRLGEERQKAKEAEKAAKFEARRHERD